MRALLLALGLCLLFGGPSVGEGPPAQTGERLPDWPQWRGPLRDGVAASSTELLETWPRRGLPRLWESEVFPRRSGAGSVVVTGGRAHVLVNWQDESPIPQRRLGGKLFGRLQWFDVDAAPATLLEELEKVRTSGTVPGERRERDRWIDGWLDERLKGREHGKWRGLFRKRLREGRGALSLGALRTLGGARDRVFESAAALESWLDEQKITGPDRSRILESVETTARIARDVVLCLDTSNGKTLWKTELEGEANDRDGSSTPTIVDGRLYVCGTTAMHCLDARTGEPVWSAPSDAAASSPLVVGEHVIALAGQLVAYRLGDGAVAWTQSEVRGKRSSPTLWTADGEPHVICNAERKVVACVRARDGALAWTAAGGGMSTPIVAGDRLVVHSGDKKLGLVAYRIAADGARRLWSRPLEGRGASSPVVHEGHVYLIGASTALCLELETGAVAWEEYAAAEISSPILADGKLVALLSRGKVLAAIDASPDAYRLLSRSKVDADRCPSPALAGCHLLLRLRDRIACFDLGRSSTP